MNSLSAKIHYLLLFILLFVIVSCNDEIVYPEGGYNYPKHVKDKDTTFYCYPLKDIKSSADSLESANTYYFLEVFDEYNLSLKSRKNPTFRLIHFSNGISSIILLTPEEIIVKKQLKGWTSPGHNDEKLTKEEKEHFELLKNFFPLNDTSHTKWRKLYFDSLTKIFPQLLDPKYYKYLLDKSADYGPEKFEYSIRKIPITKKIFGNLVKNINEAGYWRMPFENLCYPIDNDPSSFILEANTPDKYNVAMSLICSNDTTNYKKACQELINYAKMDKEIHLY